MRDAPGCEVRRVSYMRAKSALCVLCENNKPSTTQRVIEGIVCA